MDGNPGAGTTVAAPPLNRPGGTDPGVLDDAEAGYGPRLAQYRSWCRAKHTQKPLIVPPGPEPTATRTPLPEKGHGLTTEQMYTSCVKLLLPLLRPALAPTGTESPASRGTTSTTHRLTHSSTATPQMDHLSPRT